MDTCHSRRKRVLLRGPPRRVSKRPKQSKGESPARLPCCSVSMTRVVYQFETASAEHVVDSCTPQIRLQVCPYGLYAEQLSGSAFTVPRRQVQPDKWHVAIASDTPSPHAAQHARLKPIPVSYTNQPCSTPYTTSHSTPLVATSPIGTKGVPGCIESDPQWLPRVRS